MIPPGEGRANPTEKSLLERALALTRLGGRVFPVKISGKDGTIGKNPSIKGYHGDDPYSEDEVRFHPWDKADFIGLALPYSLVALNENVKRRRDGQPSHGYRPFREMTKGHGHLPTPRLQAPTGRAHLPFRLKTRLHRPPGGIPQIRLGRRIVVPTAALLGMLRLGAS